MDNFKKISRSCIFVLGILVCILFPSTGTSIGLLPPPKTTPEQNRVLAYLKGLGKRTEYSIKTCDMALKAGSLRDLRDINCNPHKTLAQRLGLASVLTNQYIQNTIDGVVNKAVENNRANIKVLDQLKACFQNQDPQCKENIERVKSQFPIAVDQARIQIAKISTLKQLAFKTSDKIDLTVSLKHPYSGREFKLEPYEQEEVRKYLADFKKNGVRRYVDSLSINGVQCTAKNPACSVLLTQTPLEATAIEKEIGAVGAEYDSLMEIAPAAQYVTKNPYQMTDSDILASVNDYQTALSKGIDDLLALPGPRRRNIFKYKSLVDHYFQNKKDLSVQDCDTAEYLVSILDTKDTMASVGLGLMAAAGPGICVMTLGAGCGVGPLAAATFTGSLASTAAQIGLVEKNYDQVKRDFLNGVASKDDLVEAAASRRMAYAIGAVSEFGSALGAVRMAQRTARSIRVTRAQSGQLAKDWDDLLTPSQKLDFENALKARPSWAKSYRDLEDTLIKVAKDPKQGVSPNLQDSLIAEIRRAASQPGGESLNLQEPLRLLREMLGTSDAARREALASDLQNYLQIIKQANSQEGKGYMEKLRNLFRNRPEKEVKEIYSCVVGK